MPPSPDPTFDDQDIAIIGLAGRFPGARTIDEFWHQLVRGVESIRPLGEDEAERDPTRRDPAHVRVAAALDGMESFDAAFFGYPPREAEIMDPQHRVFLECCWEALEHAGHAPETYPGAIGVFAGATTNTYLLFNLVSNPDVLGALDQVQIDVANGADFLSTRVSYKLDLKGPSFTVQSACSTSLVATHVACQSLLNEECDLALAGGVSIHVKHPEGYRYLPGGIVSPDGHCRAFDAQAEGTVFGSGVGVVVLKRLAEAVRDRDRIHAIIKGSAINNDGALKVGYTAPGVEGQARVIAEALAAAGVEPGTIGYVETHGTGTKMGDPIEIRALTKAFGAGQAHQRCPIGSVKTNIGHLAGAAGVASLIKAVLALEHRQIPPTLHFKAPSPEIDFARSPFYVNAALAEWPAAARGPRRAGVSSFGVGGTNAHVVLEESPRALQQGLSPPSRPVQLLLLSAKTPTALEAATTRLAQHLGAHPEPEAPFADVAYTLKVGRQAMGHRRALVCRSREEAIEILSANDPQRLWSESPTVQDRPVAFLFPGQGAEYVHMARGLYEGEPVFRERFDTTAQAFVEHLGLDLRKLVYPEGPAAETAARRLGETALAGPALFAIEWALAELWRSFGVRPRALLGNGVGEFVAACLAGVMSHLDAVALVAARGQMATMSQSPPAASLMDRVRRMRLQPPRIPLVSGVTGTWMTAVQATDPAYWARHPGEAVRLADGLKTLLAQPQQVLLEVGPGQTLGALAWRQALSSGSLVLSSTRSPQEETEDEAVLLGTLARLWLGGVTVDWSGVYAREQRSRVPLPTYPFERQRYWIEARPIVPLGEPLGAPLGEAGARPAEAGERPGKPQKIDKKPDVADWFYVPSWKQVPLAPLARAGSPAPAAAAPGWLVFCDGCGLGEALADRLVQAGGRVIRVVPGDRFERRADGVYSVDPRRREDYGALFAALDGQRAAGERWSRIVHLWSVTRDAVGLEAALDRGFYSLLYLAQALGARAGGDRDPLSWWVVASGVCKVESTDVLWPEKAPVLGPCRVLPQEHPHITCHFVDVALAHDAAAKDLAGRLHAEIQAAELPAPAAGLASVTALRGRRRWVESYEPLPLAAEARPLRPLRQGGTYLIIGGLGGMGWLLASDLARTYQARLVLVEDAAFPPREQWAGWLASHGPEDPVRQKIEHAQALEAAGTSLLVRSAAAADEAALRAVVTEAIERLGRIDGVIHAAGSLTSASLRTLQETGPAECELHFAPKVHGARTLARVLDQTLAGRPLDFVLLSSSLAAVLGGFGQAAHAAASQFMDALAELRSEAGGPPDTSPDTTWISVDWDAWQLEDPADKASMTAVRAVLGALAIQPGEGVEAVRRLLTQVEGGTVVVSTGDLLARRHQATQARSRSSGAATGEDDAIPATPEARPRASRPKHPRPALATPYVAPRSDREQTLVAVCGEVLGIEAIGIDDNFFDLGGDSLLAVQATARLKQALGVEVPAATLYQRPTVRALAELLGTDQDQAAQERSEKLARRKEELGRRNQWLHRRPK
jgi:acyl transferase domain-containing protein/acyl carrier protein